MNDIPPNRVRIQSGGKTVVGTVVEQYQGGHKHSGPSEAVRVVALDGGAPLGIFCRWCRARVDDGPEATMAPDTGSADGEFRTYAS